MLKAQTRGVQSEQMQSGEHTGPMRKKDPYWSAMPWPPVAAADYNRTPVATRYADGGKTWRRTYRTALAPAQPAPKRLRTSPFVFKCGCGHPQEGLFAWAAGGR